MTKIPGHTPFNDKGQATMIKLFSSLKDTHESLAEVAGHVIELGETTTHDQFSAILQLAIRPLIQLQIPGHLCSPADIKFDKDRLTEEETFEESCINSILLMPYHPNLSKIDYKYATRCLAATIYMTLRKRMFNMKESQAKVAERFAVHPKKLHMACSGRKYDAGKKPSKNKQPMDKQTPKQKSTTPPEPSQSDVTEKEAELQDDDEDKDLYGDTDDDESLPDLFESQEAKQPKTMGTKDVQSKDKAEATNTSEAAPMDTNSMPKLNSSDEENNQQEKDSLLRNHKSITTNNF